MASSKQIQQFRVKFSEKDLNELRDRIKRTRWPSKELVKDRSQGVQLATMKELARYWTSSYNWRSLEDRLNALPQFITNIDGLDIHFIHIKSQQANALPLILTHGWPGSVIEMLEVIEPLTDPTDHGGRDSDAFDLVIPSIPGYGFSQQPAVLNWNVGRIAKAWAELMKRLGYSRYVAQGGDVGAAVTQSMGIQAPSGLIGIHMNLFVPGLGSSPMPEKTPEELAARKAINTFNASGKGYFIEQNTRPQTISYALLDSPVAMAAWILDHDTDSYYKIASAFVDKKPSGNLTRDHILDNITMYWLTSTGASAARSYWENSEAGIKSAGKPSPAIKLPVGFTNFPGEIWRTPRSWVDKAYPNVNYYNKVNKGGHFAAWEEPELFSKEMRASFRELR